MKELNYIDLKKIKEIIKFGKNWTWGNYCKFDEDCDKCIIQITLHKYNSKIGCNNKNAPKIALFLLNQHKINKLLKIL
jgi:hypothetical protein